MQNKIAQLALQNEQRLLASSYGRFFVRRLRLGVYRKNAGEWKEWAVQETGTPTSWTMTCHNPFAFLRTMKVGRTSKARGGVDKAEAELADILSAIE